MIPPDVFTVEKVKVEPYFDIYVFFLQDLQSMLLSCVLNLLWLIIKIISTGESIEVPDMVRTVISSRMVKLYRSYCREVDRSTLFSILKVKYRV